MFGLASRQRERRLAEALAASLDAVRAGTSSLDECLQRYPDLAAELEPLLRTAARVEQVARVTPSEAARARARAAFLAEASRRRAPVTPIAAARRRAWLAFVPAVAAAALFALIAVPVLGSMDTGSVPGDWNYGFKRATERVRLALAVDPNDRRMLRLEFASRRLDEIEKLSSRGVDGNAGRIQSALRDYTAEIQQVRSSIEAAPSVPNSTAQQVQQVDSKAADVLVPVVQSAPAAPATVAQDAQAAVVTTQQTNRDAQAKSETRTSGPVTTSTQPSAASAPPTLTPTEAPTPVVTQAPPSPTAAPTATPTPQSEPTATPTPVPSPSSVATPSPAPTRSATLLPAVPAAAPSSTATTQPSTAPAPSSASSAHSPSLTTTPAPSLTAPTSPTQVVQPAPPTTATPSHTVATTSGTSIPSVPTPVATRGAIVLPVPTQTPQPQTYQLHAGPNAGIRYVGPTAPLDVVLASILPNVTVVYYPGVNGVTTAWYPNAPNAGPAPLIGSGTLLTIYVNAPVTLVINP